MSENGPTCRISITDNGESEVVVNQSFQVRTTSTISQAVEVVTGRPPRSTDRVAFMPHDRHESLESLASDVEFYYFGVGIEGQLLIDHILDSPGQVTIADLRRAHSAGYYSGNQDELIVFTSGPAGGLEPNGLVDIADWFFDEAKQEVIAAILGGVALSLQRSAVRLPITRIRRLSAQWRRQGLKRPELLIQWLDRKSWWGLDEVSTSTGLSTQEASWLLTDVGYRQTPDGRWRLSDSPTAVKQRELFERGAQYDDRLGPE